jgi:large subunit ribosomal protein L5
MRAVRVEKVVLNIGCGTKLPVETAQTMLERITGRKVVITKSQTRSTFSVPKGKPIGCKVTVRRRKGAEELLRSLLQAREGKLPAGSFDATGNVAFGVKEYIDVPGVEYDPKMPMIGFDVCVTLERPGYRTKRKRLGCKVGKAHTLTAADAAEFMKSAFGVEVVKKEKAEEW